MIDVNNNQSNTSQSNNEPHSNSSGNSQVVINNNKNTQLETYSGGETQQNPSGLNSEFIITMLKKFINLVELRNN